MSQLSGHWCIPVLQRNGVVNHRGEVVSILFAFSCVAVFGRMPFTIEMGRRHIAHNEAQGFADAVAMTAMGAIGTYEIRPVR